MNYFVFYTYLLIQNQTFYLFLQGHNGWIAELDGVHNAQTSFGHGVYFSKEQSPKTPQEIEDMRHIPYASAVGSLMYAMLCTWPDICYAVEIVSRY